MGAVDIRELIFDLRHEGREPFGQWATRAVQRWSTRTAIPAEVRQEGWPAVLPPRLDYDLRQALEEALLNVERHAVAKAVSVSLGTDARSLVLDVRDDGDGRPGGERDGAQKGVGLLSMKERMEQWGGRLEFANGAGGAILRLSVPWPPVPAMEGERG
ncbi:MAG: ATP-binding protein [Dehalococcoidia bacterium]